MVMIREYDPIRDAEQIRAGFIELQDYERTFETDLPPGHLVVEAYLKTMFTRCNESRGKVFIAEIDGEVVGFVCVLAKVRPTEPDEPPAEYAFISDLVVLPAFRGRGLGRVLLQQAERYAREQGATVIRLIVLAQNTTARQLYSSCGFAERFLQLSKRLDNTPSEDKRP